MTAKANLIRLFEFEPDLLNGVPPRHAEVATHHVVVESLTWEPGIVAPAATAADDALMCVVLDGLLVRRSDAYGRRAVEILGPGDVFSPREDRLAGDLSEARVTWRAYTRTRLALLDERWVEAMVRWPQVTSAIVERATMRTMRLADQLALAQVRELDRRLLCLFWSLAARWGTVGPTGTTLDLPLDHEVLAALASARRPSVTSALGRLRAEGLVERSSRGCWRLHGPAPSEVRQRGDLSLVGSSVG